MLKQVLRIVYLLKDRTRKITQIKVQNDRLVSSLLRKYSDRKKEIKDARKHWKIWEEEKIEIQKRKIQRQKLTHVSCSNLLPPISAVTVIVNVVIVGNTFNHPVIVIYTNFMVFADRNELVLILELVQNYFCELDEFNFLRCQEFE